MKIIKKIIFLFLLTSYASIIMIFFIIIKLLLPDSCLRKFLLENLKSSFGEFLLFLVWVFSPFKLVLFCDKKTKYHLKNKDKKKLFFVNHQLYTDWVYIWAFFINFNLHRNIRIVLKNQLENLPIFGWGMKLFDFIFLARNWNLDKSKFLKTINEMKINDNGFSTLIFPEGNLFYKESHDQAIEFANQNNLEIPRYCIIPKSRGLFHLKDTASKVFDITMIFDHESPYEKYPLDSVFFGEGPKIVKLYVSEFDSKSLPKDYKLFSKWLRKRFILKDSTIEIAKKQLYKNSKIAIDIAIDDVAHSSQTRRADNSLELRENNSLELRENNSNYEYFDIAPKIKHVVRFLFISYCANFLISLLPYQPFFLPILQK